MQSKVVKYDGAYDGARCIYDHMKSNRIANSTCFAVNISKKHAKHCGKEELRKIAMKQSEK